MHDGVKAEFTSALCQNALDLLAQKALAYSQVNTH
jgi:hypothetical protein